MSEFVGPGLTSTVNRCRCDPCDKGSYQDQVGSQSCKRCDVAWYQDEEGSAQCKASLGCVGSDETTSG